MALPQTVDSALPKMTSDEFWRFCRRHPDLRIERSAEGEVVIMPPTGGETGISNVRIGRYLDEWTENNGGYAFDSSTLFRLPNGADRSPDAAWVAADRWEALSREDRERPAPLCPDFVIELLSPTDPLSATQAKMEEFRANGARLGWLIDRKARTVSIYRPDHPVETLSNPTSLSGEPVLPGFVLNLQRIW